MIGKIFNVAKKSVVAEAKGKIPGFGAAEGVLSSFRGDNHPVEDALLEPLSVIESKVDCLMIEVQKKEVPKNFETPKKEEKMKNPTVSVRRFLHNEISTIGIIEVPPVGNEIPTRAFVLEDPYQEKKIPGNTRIPAGIYPMALQTGGEMTKDYALKFPNFHRGMLHIQDVEDFTGVFIHIGNEPKDTEGCLLVGDIFSFSNRNFIGASADAYQRIYCAVLSLMDSTEAPISIDISDNFIAGSPQIGESDHVAQVAGFIMGIGRRLEALESRIGI